MERRIVHIDMDAFFASVEVVRDPSLKGKPLIIGGNKEDIRGVVSTASYEARKFGVHSAMPLVQAKKLCPHGIFMRGHISHYREASRKIRAILETVTPHVQMASIDEAYMDVSGSQRIFGGDDGIATYIKGEITAQTGLPCTVAITANKLVSKVASDEGKPDGYLRVATGEERAFMAPLAVRKLPGAGPRTCDVLEGLGIVTLGQLAHFDLVPLECAFGHQTAISLQRRAQGISTSEVEVERAAKSISRETTFPEDVSGWEQVEQTLAYLTERCMYTLREEGLEAKRVILKVRYSNFETKTFAHTFADATAIDCVVTTALQELIEKGKRRCVRIRLIGVGLDQLRYNQHQMPLFGGKNNEKWERVLEKADAVREKHGFKYLRSGKSLGLGREVRLATPSLSR
ncbi:MAG: DNA polymerase IV [Candidatus Hydrogenedentes bacterium]|nr:DNA polymerase IV [Candidatus Hydrogenedentota bacterium]